VRGVRGQTECGLDFSSRFFWSISFTEFRLLGSMVDVMPKQKRKQQQADDSAAEMPGSERVRERRSREHTRRSGDDESMGHERHGIPRWRKIEIMRERAQLREALGGVDLFDDFDDFEEEVFGSEEEYDVFYRHSDEDEEVEVELEDDEFEEDEFEDPEED